MSGNKAVTRRLSSYWKMEAFAAFFVPLFAFFQAPPRDLVEGAALGLSVLAAVVLLVIGALYWRAVLRRAEGERRPLASILDIADTAERPVLALTVAAPFATAAATILNGWSSAVIAAWICAALAMLEFVNYYRIQLQHFDNAADFKRLLAGRGFRQAHLARDLAAFRKRSLRQRF